MCAKVLSTPSMVVIVLLKLLKNENYPLLDSQEKNRILLFSSTVLGTLCHSIKMNH